MREGKFEMSGWADSEDEKIKSGLKRMEEKIDPKAVEQARSMLSDVKSGRTIKPYFYSKYYKRDCIYGIERAVTDDDASMKPINFGQLFEEDTNDGPEELATRMENLKVIITPEAHAEISEFIRDYEGNNRYGGFHSLSLEIGGKSFQAPATSDVSASHFSDTEYFLWKSAGDAWLDIQIDTRGNSKWGVHFKYVAKMSDDERTLWVENVARRYGIDPTTL